MRDTESQHHRITESQNCRGWKGPQEIIKSNSPAKQSPYNRRPGQPVLVFCHPYCEEVPSHIGVELPVLHFMAISACSVHTGHWKEVGHVPLTSILKIFINTNKILSYSSQSWTDPEKTSEESKEGKILNNQGINKKLILFDNFQPAHQWR